MDLMGTTSEASQPLRISWAFPAFFSHPIGGYHVHYEYANRLAARGHFVTLLFPRSLSSYSNAMRAWVWARRLEVRHRPLISGYRIDPRVRVRLVPNLEPQALPDADILIATAWQTAEAMRNATPRAGRKHYIVYDYEHWLAADSALKARIGDTFRLGYRMLAASSAVVGMIRENGGHESGFAPCGIDPAVFALDRPIVERSNGTVMFAARIEENKNLPGALAAVEALRQRHGPSLRVIAFGAGELRLPPDIEYHPRPSNRQLRELYNQSSIFLCSSYGEGWGLPSVEAMSCGAALVTTDNGGCRDYARMGETALIVEGFNPAAMARSVSTLIENPTFRVQLALAGHDWVKRYLWDDATDLVERFLQK